MHESLYWTVVPVTDGRVVRQLFSGEGAGVGGEGGGSGVSGDGGEGGGNGVSGDGGEGEGEGGGGGGEAM